MKYRSHILAIAAAVSLCSVATTTRTASAQETGTISGTVALRQTARRTAGRYPGGAAGAHRVQLLPAAAYLKGRVGGARPPGRRETAQMLQTDTAFVPAVLVVTVGEAVSFPNRDPFFHNVFSMSRTKRFDLGRYPEGETKDVTFDGPGTVEVFCEVHNFMRGAILVSENPYHGIVQPDGTFTISDVPPGTHTVVVWHADYGTVEREVSVAAGNDVRIEVELNR